MEITYVNKKEFTASSMTTATTCSVMMPRRTPMMSFISTMTEVIHKIYGGKEFIKYKGVHIGGTSRHTWHSVC